MTKKDKSALSILTLFLCLIFSFFSIHAQEHSNYVQIIMQPTAHSWDYKVGENVDLNVSVLRNNIPLQNITVSYEYGLEGMPIEKKGELYIKENMEKLTMGTISVPGFKRCIVTAMVDDITYSSMMTVAYSPNKIEPTVKMPNDFDSFWKNELFMMRNADTNIHQTILDEYSTTENEVSLLDISVPECEIAFYGYLSKPKKEGKYPVVLYLPGAGIGPSNPIINLINENVITFSIEIHGLNPTGEAKIYSEIKNKFMSYPYIGVESRENFYYKSVIMACLKAADYIGSFAQFDNTNLITFGGSQGGFLSIATAALHEKVTGVVAFHPSMADLTGYFHNRIGGCPHYFAPKFNDIYNSESIITTLSYFDTVNFARRISVPGFYSFRYNDVTCPPTTSFAVTNSINAPKTLFLTPITGHWRINEMMTKSTDWVVSQIMQK